MQVLRSRTVWPIVSAVVWFMACLTGFSVLWSYSNTPGKPGLPPRVWPAGDRVQLDTSRPTLIMFVHPRCPCTASSMSQLERLQGRFPGAFATRFVLYEPAKAGAEWRSTRLWTRAAAMPDAETIVDAGGLIARTCGADVSGLVGVYSPDGSPMFWGGLTIARGHEGDNPGTDAVAAILRGEQPGLVISRVFGCCLTGATEPCTDEQECDHDGYCRAGK